MNQLKLLFVIIFFFLNFAVVNGQIPEAQIKDFISRISDWNTKDDLSCRDIIAVIKKSDSNFVKNLLDRLEKEKPSGDELYNLRFLYLKIYSQRIIAPSRGLEAVKPYLDSLLKQSIESRNNRFIGLANWVYGSTMYQYQQLELSNIYCLRGIELLEKEKNVTHIRDYYYLLGEILYHTREYEKCIYYTHKAISTTKDTLEILITFIGKHYNTIGQAYYHLGNIDSALISYNLADKEFDRVNNELWKGINSCFKGHIYFDKKEYKKAKSLFQYAYTTNINKENIIAGYSLAWLGRVLILENKLDSAQACLNKAAFLLKNAPIEQRLQSETYLQQVYFAKMDLHRMLNNSDSLQFYTKQYFNLHDSLEHVASISNSKIAQLRIDYEKNQAVIETVLADRESSKLNSAIIIALLICSAISVIFYLNRQRKQQQIIFETQVLSVKEEIKQYSEDISDKSLQLEQFQKKQNEQDYQETINRLSDYTILTDKDWDSFKQLFETVYPAFFLKLNAQIPGITSAEQRLAAFIKLYLNNKKIASILGISVDSVYKTRQRLKQRINTTHHDDNIDEFIAGL